MEGKWESMCNSLILQIIKLTLRGLMIFHPVPQLLRGEPISNIGLSDSVIVFFPTYFHYKGASRFFNGLHKRILGQVTYFILLFKT